MYVEHKKIYITQANIRKLGLIVWVVGVSILGLWASPHSIHTTETSLVACGTRDTQSHLPEGFVYLVDVDPSIRQDVRYAGKLNFVGRPIEGYERATVILTAAAAQALAGGQAALKKLSYGQWSLKVYDGYRPQRASDDLWRWGQDVANQKMKAEFYPDVADKLALFQGYIAKRSGHSRGSTVDVTIEQDDSEALARDAEGLCDTCVDMGSPFDLFDSRSHYGSEKISEEAQKNRKFLRDLMVAYGFVPYEKEWWHFSLKRRAFS